MFKTAAFAMLGATLSFAAVPAYAGGSWGGKAPKNYNHSFNTFAADNNYSSGFANVSPSVKIGDLNVGNGILSNSPILSGVGIGILGTGTGLTENLSNNLNLNKINTRGQR